MERPWQDRRETSNGRGYKNLKRSATQGKVDPPFDRKSGDTSESGNMWDLGYYMWGFGHYLYYFIFL